MTAARELRRLVGIVDLPIRVAAVERHFRRVGPTTLAMALEQLVRGANHARPRDTKIFLACALWILRTHEADVASLRVAAEAHHLLVTASMLADAPRHMMLAPKGRLREVGLPETYRVSDAASIRGTLRA